MKLSLICVAACVVLGAAGVFGLQGSDSRESTAPETEMSVSGDNDEAFRTEELKEFTSLTVNLPVEVIYTHGDPKVVIVSRERNLSHILVEQDGESGDVTVRADDRKLRLYGQTKLYISSRSLSSLTANGSVKFTSKDPLRSYGDFTLTANGTATVSMDELKSKAAVIQCNGACSLEIGSLSAKTLDVTGNGTANVKIDGISGKDMEVTINGAGRARLSGKISGTARLNINGAGSIDVKSLEAKTIRPSVKGVGSIVTE